MCKKMFLFAAFKLGNVQLSVSYITWFCLLVCLSTYQIIAVNFLWYYHQRGALSPILSTNNPLGTNRIKLSFVHQGFENKLFSTARCEAGDLGIGNVSQFFRGVRGFKLFGIWLKKKQVNSVQFSLSSLHKSVVFLSMAKLNCTLCVVFIYFMSALPVQYH